METITLTPMARLAAARNKHLTTLEEKLQYAKVIQEAIDWGKEQTQKNDYILANDGQIHVRNE